jgi:hypothetical protein
MALSLTAWHALVAQQPSRGSHPELGSPGSQHGPHCSRTVCISWRARLAAACVHSTKISQMPACALHGAPICLFRLPDHDLALHLSSCASEAACPALTSMMLGLLCVLLRHVWQICTASITFGAAASVFTTSVLSASQQQVLVRRISEW